MLLLLVCSVGCGNRVYVRDNHEYSRIHVGTSNYVDCFEVDKYFMEDTGIGVTTTDGDVMWLSVGTYILVEDECPICKVIEESKGLFDFGSK